MNPLRSIVRYLLSAGALLVSCVAIAGAPEHSDVANQGGGGVYADDGATLVRQRDGILASMRVPTPASGTYNYPAGRVAGHPEAFTLWAFVFNFHALCNGPCDSDDIGDTLAQGGAYNVSGHAIGRGQFLNIAGRIATGDEAFSGAWLVFPKAAEVHLALAPHGALDPKILPSEFRTPTGPAAFWWVGVFG